MLAVPQSTSLLVVFKAYADTDHVTEATGKTIAITISKNGGAFGNPNVGATNATEISSGWYKVTLDTTDTGTVGPLAVRGTNADIDDVGVLYYVVKATNGGWTALPDTAVTTNASLITSGTGTAQLSVSGGKALLQDGAVTAAVVATGAIDADALAADAGTEIGTAVWATAARTLTALDEDSTALDLNATIAAAVWDASAASHQSVGTFGPIVSEILSLPNTVSDQVWESLAAVYVSDGSFGKIIGDNLNATVSSRATQTSVDDLPTNAELATALGTADDAVLAQIALVKAKTDSLTFTVAGHVDANIQYVNDVEVTGTGAAGDEWGP